jgi:hypothetical protein
MFLIEKGVDIGVDQKRVSWPWKNMDVGDSVLFEGSFAHRAQVNCHVYGRQSGKKFSSRKEGDGMRVWRIE